MSSPILPGATIGILGSGQLGRMMAIEARNLGYGIQVYSPERNTPTGQIADVEVVAAYNDIDALQAFARAVSVVTYEFENVPAETVDAIESVGTPVRPGADVLYVAQNRLREKSFFQSLGISTAPFAPIDSINDVAIAVQHVSLPAILKTADSGYDGKGQRSVQTEAQVLTAFIELGSVPCVLEGRINFSWEGSVVAARGVSGDFAHYGLVRNHHVDSILDVTIAPAPYAPATVIRSAVSQTRAIMEALQVIGVLCVEFFVLDNGQLLANEMAPRPHNSGHWTQDGCATSQFEQQLRAICGLTLGDTRRHFPSSTMVNLLGDTWTDTSPDFATMFREYPDAKLHLYGKSEPRPGRKMGHVNVGHETPESAETRARAIRDCLIHKK